MGIKIVSVADILKEIGLVKEIIERLENIPDGCSEMFPFQDIDELKNEYIGFE